MIAEREEAALFWRENNGLEGTSCVSASAAAVAFFLHDWHAAHPIGGNFNLAHAVITDGAIMAICCPIL